MDDQEEREENLYNLVRHTKICKYCRSEIPDNAKVCKHCKRSQRFDGKVINGILIGIVIMVWIFVLNNPELRNSLFSGSKNTTSSIKIPTSARQIQREYKYTKEQLISECREIDYKELARNPEKYTGTKVVVTLGISQTINGLFKAGDNCYRAYSNNGYGWYQDEYAIIDQRESGSTKILNNDIVKVYGEFAGVQKITRAIGKVEDDIVTINMYYAEIIGDTRK